MTKRRAKGLQVAVWDLGGNPLSQTVTDEIEKAVVGVLKRLKEENESKYTTLAHTVVSE